MSPVFDLHFEALAADPRFRPLADRLRGWSRLDSPAAFNRFAREACRLWAEQFAAHPVGSTSPRFDSLLAGIERRETSTIPTSWGGVSIVRHEHPLVEKYLVIRQGGYLALEKHEQKDEHLEAMEGAGLILHRREAGAALEVEAIEPGARFHLSPGREHCLVGAENLLVFERSTDPKGMDRDLVFIFTPDSR